MKISAKHIIGVSVAVTLLAGGVAPDLNARAQEEDCPTHPCPGPFGENDCSVIGPGGLCTAYAQFCTRFLNYGMCSNLYCGGGAICYWS